ncbi:MAG: YHS domain-containing protein [Planctomycetes bacterium]|nr:YHS domain-containing protein [Planctomycetota bacterium]
MLTFVVGLSSTYTANILWACGGACGGNEHRSHEGGEYAIQAKAETKAEKAESIKDPVCDMEIVDIKKASLEEYNGKVYYFCSEYCKKEFKKNPASYAAEETHQHDEDERHSH